jgi:hypothetical protein
MEEAKKGRFSAGPLIFVVRHELWDGNIQDHPDQGVAILVMADVAGKETALLRFRLTGHPGLPLEPTPNFGAAD